MMLVAVMMAGGDDGRVGTIVASIHLPAVLAEVIVYMYCFSSSFERNAFVAECVCSSKLNNTT